MPEDETAAQRGMDASRVLCAVKVPTFEGPLDLLLHLIRANEVDIHDIPIALISEQYLEYLGWMRQLDIDVAAEYLVMAATLAYIKSRMLLPPEWTDDDGDETEDPRAELARRLAEYARFKEVALELNARPQLGRDVFRPSPDLSTVGRKEPVLDASLFAMIEALRRVLANLPEEDRRHQIPLESITLQDRLVAVLDRLHESAGRILLFEELLIGEESTRARVVMTFLAILELARSQVLRLFQNVTEEGLPFGPVRVRLAVIPGVGETPMEQEVCNA